MLDASELKAKIEEFRKRIIGWYRQYGDKDIPWRNTDNPWHVLVATFLLRKTTTNQVLKLYNRFVERYPDPQSLLKASEEEVKEMIKPLGMEHKRAKLIIRLARMIVSKFGGRIPCSLNKLKELPGVGTYTASEVLLVACRKPEPLLDRNMIRVVQRVFGVGSSKKRPHTDPKMWAFARMLVPKDPDAAREFNYGVLDFARKICTARRPRCGTCPLADICSYFLQTNSGK